MCYVVRVKPPVPDSVLKLGVSGKPYTLLRVILHLPLFLSQAWVSCRPWQPRLKSSIGSYNTTLRRDGHPVVIHNIKDRIRLNTNPQRIGITFIKWLKDFNLFRPWMKHFNALEKWNKDFYGNTMNQAFNARERWNKGFYGNTMNQSF